MSKRVYEIARELDLSTQEVIGHLNDSGIEVKSNFAVVEDLVYERVFGDSSDGAAPNGRSEVQEAGALPSMIQTLRKRLLPRRVLVYILVAALALAVAAGVGAMAALTMRGVLTQQNEADYVSKVGKIQSSSVEAFLGSHDRLVPYDALTADDVEEMRLNQAALEEFADQVDGLDPPQEYREHYEVFSSAINELHEAARLAYGMAADPVAATESGFEEYDSHVNEAEAHLQRSNEMLGRDFETIGGVQRVSRM
jgi:hypothetical protein